MTRAPLDLSELGSLLEEDTSTVPLDLSEIPLDLSELDAAFGDEEAGINSPPTQVGAPSRPVMDFNQPAAGEMAGITAPYETAPTPTTRPEMLSLLDSQRETGLFETEDDYNLAKVRMLGKSGMIEQEDKDLLADLRDRKVIRGLEHNLLHPDVRKNLEDEYQKKYIPDYPDLKFEEFLGLRQIPEWVRVSPWWIREPFHGAWVSQKKQLESLTHAGAAAVGVEGADPMTAIEDLQLMDLGYSYLNRTSATAAMIGEENTQLAANAARSVIQFGMAGYLGGRLGPTIGGKGETAAAQIASTKIGHVPATLVAEAFTITAPRAYVEGQQQGMDKPKASLYALWQTAAEVGMMLVGGEAARKAGYVTMEEIFKIPVARAALKSSTDNLIGQFAKVPNFFKMVGAETLEEAATEALQGAGDALFAETDEDRKKALKGLPRRIWMGAKGGAMGAGMGGGLNLLTFNAVDYEKDMKRRIKGAVEAGIDYAANLPVTEEDTRTAQPGRPSKAERQGYATAAGFLMKEFKRSGVEIEDAVRAETFTNRFQQIKDALPSLLVEAVAEKKFRARLNNGKHFLIEFGDMPTVAEEDMADYFRLHKMADTPTNREILKKSPPKGGLFFVSPTARATELGVFRIWDQLESHGLQVKPVVMHEAFHLAYRLGMINDGEFQSLARRYSRKGRTLEEQEEDIALGLNTYNEHGKKFRERMKDFFSSLTNVVRVGSPDASRVRDNIARGEMFLRGADWSVRPALQGTRTVNQESAHIINNYRRHMTKTGEKAKYRRAVDETGKPILKTDGSYQMERVDQPDRQKPSSYVDEVTRALDFFHNENPRVVVDMLAMAREMSNQENEQVNEQISNFREISGTPFAERIKREVRKARAAGRDESSIRGFDEMLDQSMMERFGINDAEQLVDFLDQTVGELQEKLTSPYDYLYDLLISGGYMKVEQGNDGTEVYRYDPDPGIDVDIDDGSTDPWTPPVRPGFIRMYHGGVDQEGRGARDFSPQYEYASEYARKTQGGTVTYVDVPIDSPHLNQISDISGTDTPPESNIGNSTLPNSIASSRKLYVAPDPNYDPFLEEGTDLSDVPFDEPAVPKVPFRVQTKTKGDMPSSTWMTEHNVAPDISPAALKNDKDFMEWFESPDESVTDKNGNPKRFFHGTSAGNPFTEFSTYAYSSEGPGSYFTDNAEVATGYTQKGTREGRPPRGEAGPRIYPVYLNIKKPLDLDAKADFHEWANGFGRSFHPEGSLQEQAKLIEEATEESSPGSAIKTNRDVLRGIELSLFDEFTTEDEATEHIQASIGYMGYDSLKHIGGIKSGRNHQVVIAFDPENIRPVFNPNNFTEQELTKAKLGSRTVSHEARPSPEFGEGIVAFDEPAVPHGKQYEYRPDKGRLANPLNREEDRQKYYEIAEQQGPPTVVHDADVQAAARHRLHTAYDEELKDKLSKARKSIREDTPPEFGSQLENAIVRQLLDQEARRSLVDPESARNFHELSVGWLREGTEEGRALRARRDNRYTLDQEGRFNLLLDAITEPDEITKKKIRKAKNKSERQRWLLKDQNRRKAIDEQLNTYGVPMDEDVINAIAMDEDMTFRLLGEIHAVGRFHTNPMGKVGAYSDWLYEYNRSMMMSAIPTWVVNAGSTAANMVRTLGFEKVLQAAYGKALGDPRAPRFEDIAYMYKNIGTAMTHAALAFRKSYELEVGWTAHELGLQDIERYRYERPNYSIPGKAGKLIRGPGFRVALAVDEFNKSAFVHLTIMEAAHHMALQKLILDEGMWIDDPTFTQRLEEEMRIAQEPGGAAWQRSLEETQRAAFQRGGELAERINAAMLSAKENFPLVRWFFPFTQTPVFLAEQIIKRAPVVGAIYDYGEARFIEHKTMDEKGGWTATMARQTVPLIGALLLNYLNSDDDEEKGPFVTGARELTTYSRREMAYRTHQPLSIRVPDWVPEQGGTRTSYGRLDPFAGELAITADMVQAFKQGKPFSGTAKSLYANVMSKTYLENMSQLVEAGEMMATGEGRAERGFLRLGVNMAGSFVPNFYKTPVRATKENLPDTAIWGDKKFMWMALRRLGQRSQLMRDDFPKLDLWGRHIPTSRVFRKNDGTTVLDKVENLISPTTDFLFRATMPTVIYDRKVTKPDQFLLAWNRQHPDSPYRPTPPNRYWQHKGKALYLTPREYYEYASTAGQLAFKRAEKIKWNTDNTSEYQMKLMKRVIENGRTAAKRRMFRRVLERVEREGGI